jgi:hypothetical protein
MSFTKTQLFVGGMVFVFAGIGLSIAGAVTKNAFMTGTGASLLAFGLGWLGLQRPTDASTPE